MSGWKHINRPEEWRAWIPPHPLDPQAAHAARATATAAMPGSNVQPTALTHATAYSNNAGELGPGESSTARPHRASPTDSGSHYYAIPRRQP